MHLVFFCLLLRSINCFFTDMSDNRSTGNCNDGQPYVVGILSPSTTLYIDQMIQDNGNHTAPPNDLNLTRRNANNSFQITSVTVQGSRKNEDFAYDSADDLDESRTDDLSSDLLDSSRADNEGYHSEDLLEDLASPCAPIIFAQLPANVIDRNMNLSIGVTPTYTAIGPVAGGVTMMTSKSESPISAQVPIMNPLPNNWQRRFKVVKIMSSEPFQKGRWVCMDFKDPPPDGPIESKPEWNGIATPPAIEITNYDPEVSHDELLNSVNFAQVYEIPINQTFSGNFVVGNPQHMYGIILPQDDHLQPVTLIQDLSLQTTALDRNYNNNFVNNQSNLVHTVPSDPQPGSLSYSQPVAMAVSNGIPDKSPPVSQNVPIYDNPSDAVLKQSSDVLGNNNVLDDVATVATLTSSRVRTNSESKRIELANQVFGGLARPNTTQVDSESSQTAPEKIPSEVGQEVDPSAGSAVPTGANTVAIDNKIEQAMDLVKSHLMFAVREEVEVLKEKITELLERISQLEHENDILRANASAETLKQLNNQFQKKPLNSGSVGKQQPIAPVLPSST